MSTDVNKEPFNIKPTRQDSTIMVFQHIFRKDVDFYGNQTEQNRCSGLASNMGIISTGLVRTFNSC